MANLAWALGKLQALEGQGAGAAVAALRAQAEPQVCARTMAVSLYNRFLLFFHSSSYLTLFLLFGTMYALLWFVVIPLGFYAFDCSPWAGKEPNTYERVEEGDDGDLSDASEAEYGDDFEKRR